MRKYYIKKAESGDVIDQAKQTQLANLTGPSGLVSGVLDAGIDASTDIENNLLGFERDSVDDVANSAAKIATKFGPMGYVAAAGIKGLNFATKAFGENVKGFDGGTGSSGFQDFTTQSKQFRGLNPFGASKSSQAYQAQVSKQKEKFAAAKSIVEQQKQQNEARKQSLGNQNISTQQQLDGGLDYSSVLAKEGGQLNNLIERVEDSNIVEVFVQNLQKITALKNGGSVIPSGALHKNKHNLEIDELDGKITTKGIPVISVEEGGEIIQHAEIERDEVILEITLSKKLEKLYYDGSDEAATEAGRLLANELMESTTDNTGLINKITGDED